MNADRRLRVGAVNYLNTKPLVYNLATFAPEIDLVFDYPSYLADHLACNQLDVALIPCVEFLRQPGYRIVSDACIACQGPVLSVKCYFRKPPQQVETLALDGGSRTSAALVQILLEQRFGLRPRLVTLPVQASWQETTADAILLIGDRAIGSPPGSFAAVWDLGDEWVRWTGLPFVFAMWVAAAGKDLGSLETSLSAARDAGVAHLPQIAAREGAPLGLTVPQCLSYLRDNLYFHLGSRERAGLKHFAEHAARLGLIPQGVDLGSIDTTAAR